ncbi:ferritin-like domain-containing protein [Chitinophaga sp. 212800010-3]|uniref:ferritin-like domain-containing protein n=1 Tax=unclassified Chitinophaga TaxID=2619133 RepID=UPI002DEDD1B5|nr:Ferritin-like domain-containing protein [Chitinophaga sp. 212800010-3]
MKPKNDAYRLLVALLQEAAQLEHCLLNAYLYTACSIKSTPQEFEKTKDGQDNRRAAVQFELARSWKQSILFVGHEEMLHLHYVQCMLRGIGERPCFTLPPRDKTSGNWIISNWKATIGEVPVDDGKGVQIPVNKLTLENIQNFVLYESTDALQDQDPFGPASLALFKQLFELEMNFRIESMLFNVADDEKRKNLSDRLYDIYMKLPPLEQPAAVAREMAEAAVGLPSLEELHFQSIADFYQQGIQPLYAEAFHNQWVVNNNRNLVNELLNPEYAGEGFLPIGPVYRSKNFTTFNKKNTGSSYRDVKTVDDIIKEIVEEGEGATHFEEGAAALLAKVAELGGPRAYLLAYQANYNSRGNTTPQWMQDCENIRQSHLYRFAMIMMGLRNENDLAKQSNLTFEAFRKPLDAGNNAYLQKITAQIPQQFNVCYLVMIMWLSRMYETYDWNADESRREAIEMLASWPIMSIAIRPFLELASMFNINKQQLFSFDPADLPVLPLYARQLLELYTADARSEAINDEMDYYAINALEEVAKWAAAQIEPIKTAAIADEHLRSMILTRLDALSVVGEFKKQFPFREHGGYSGKMPDLTYQQDHPESDVYEEAPVGDNGGKTFQDAFLLRLRFAGWGKVQLSTDPDPPTDESGCTGTHMLHSADGNRKLNRALVWQHTNDSQILREPLDKLPELGVNCVDISLMAAGKNTSVGFVPLQVMQSVGAVQTSGVQQKLAVTGVQSLFNIAPGQITGSDQKKIRMDLLPKNGLNPLLLGENHLVWQDGEPIDPFILAVKMDTGADAPVLLTQREIYNEGKRMIDMTPLERIYTNRAPVGFDSVNNIPAWARKGFSAPEKKMIGGNGYPMSYLRNRSQQLEDALQQSLLNNESLTAQKVSEVVSLAERMSLVAIPRGTTVAWLNYTLHYGHTVSGNLQNGSSNPILDFITKNTGLVCSVAAPKNRSDANARWLVNYTKGIMDTDALSDFVFGELYIPLTISNVNGNISFKRTWKYNIALLQPLQGFACQFQHPFWNNDYAVQGNTRTLKVSKDVTITETLDNTTSAGYSYALAGYPGITSCTQTVEMAADTTSNTANLNWTIQFTATDQQALISFALFFVNQSNAVADALHQFTEPE